MGHFFSLLTSNVTVLIIAFVLSFFYGASAIFLVILNASIFANFIIFVADELAISVMQGLYVFLTFLIHLVPEISGFLLAALAGGVISKAVIKEKRNSVAFRNVFKDATILITMAFLFIVLSAFLETFVTTSLFRLVF